MSNAVTDHRIAMLEKRVEELTRNLQFVAAELGAAKLKLKVIGDRQRLEVEQKMRGVRT